MKSFKEHITESLTLASVKSQGILFKTGKPVSFTVIHNKEKAPYMGSRYQQDIEPVGYYCLQSRGGQTPEGFESVKVTLKNPLVLYLNLNQDRIYDDNSWKAQLVKEFGLKGKLLTKFLVKDGYDGIITVDKKHNETSEIVLLKKETLE